MSKYPRPWGISPPLYVPPPAPKTTRAQLITPVSLALAFAVAMIGMGFWAVDHISDLIGAMR